MANPRTRRRSSESLIAPEALGGVLARRGMRFQDLWLLQQLTHWMVDPLFRGYVNEGREDVDTFQYQDDSRSKDRIERWQLKDRLVTKALLAEVLSGFEAQHEERLAKRHEPIWRFHLVAATSHEDLSTLPDLVDRVRQSRTAYGADGLNYQESLEDLSRRLDKLGARAGAGFVSERVHLNFRAGWVSEDDNYWRTVEALLMALGIAKNRTRAAADRLFVSVTGNIGKLVTRDAIVDSLKEFEGPRSSRTSRAKRAASAGASRARSSLGSATAASHCMVTYFPDESLLFQFPDGTCGLIDCGPAAVRHLVPYLAKYSIDRLSFFAVSHWYHDHYAGIPALLNAVSHIDHMWLTLETDLQTPLARSRMQSITNPRARQVLERLVDRIRRNGGRVHFGDGLEWIYRTGRRSDADAVCVFAPSCAEFGAVRHVDFSQLSSAYLVRVGGQQLLIGAHAHGSRWAGVVESARARDVTIRANAFFLPHYGSRRSLTPQMIKTLVSPGPFVALLPLSERIAQRYPNITDHKVLDEVRAAGGRIVVCDRSEPMHFVMNREGLFQALSPVPGGAPGIL